MSKFLIFFQIILLSLEARAATHRGGAEFLNAKAYSVRLDATLFSMTAHYNNDGVEVPKNAGSSYRMIDTDFKISYGLSSNVEISLLAKMRSVNSNDGINSNTNSGPESLGTEAKYAFHPINNFRYAIGIHYRQTLYTNTQYATLQNVPATEVILGDDGSEYGVNFYTTYLANSWKFDFKVGYNSPPNDLSSELIYDFYGLYKFTKLSLIVGVEGIKSLNRDQYTDTPNLKPFMSKGESYQFNSLNREKTAPYLGANYAFKNVLLGIKGQSIISGKSTDKGNLISVNLIWNSEGETPESIKINKFKEYNIEGSVLKVSARGNFIKIDQGLSTDVEKGTKFDIFQTDYFGGNDLVASGVVHDIGSDWAVIKLTKKFKKVEIKPGFAARGY